MKKEINFDWYYKAKNDAINNAAYALVVALTAKSASPRKSELSVPQWDDLMIANIVDGAITAVDERIGYFCRPFYRKESNLPCYIGDCCDTPHCIFKDSSDYQKALPSNSDSGFEEGGETNG